MKPIRIISIVFIIAIVSACTLDYKVTCKDISWTYNDPYLTVTATVENTGNKTTYNTQIDITVQYTGNSTPSTEQGTINADTLAPFSSKSVSTTIYVGSYGSFTVEDIDITSIGFDESNSSFQ